MVASVRVLAWSFALVLGTAPVACGGAPSGAPGAGAPSVGAAAATFAAFPGAQGGGARALGGRGGRVYEVTTLADSGPGSLRACVEAQGPRTCVFRVGGVITVRTALRIRNPFLTIAGQTAPGDGIAIRLGTPGMASSILGFTIDTHDVVIRYLRIWGDWVANQTTDRNPGTACFVMSSPGSRDIVVDHVTCLWASSIGYSTWHGPGRITLQWSLWGENVSNPASGAGRQAVALLFAPGQSGDYEPDAGGDVDIHHNVIATATHRNPALCGTGMRFVNNIVHNWSRASFVDSGFPDNAHGASVADFVGNLYTPGRFGKTTSGSAGYHEIMANRGVARLFVSGNASEWRGPAPGNRGPVGAEGDQWSLTSGNVSEYQGADQPDLTPLPEPYRRPTPLCAQGQSSGCTAAGDPGPAIAVDPVSRLRPTLLAPGGVGMSRLLACDGSWRSVSDGARDRVLAYVADGTGPGAPPLSAAAANGGALPALSNGDPCVDTDHDGMPDAWEVAHGLDPNDPTDGALLAPDGYSNLEHFLNGR